MNSQNQHNWPTVTQVLQPYTDYSMVPEHVLTRKTEIGKTVHQYCAGICRGLYVGSIPPECAGYVKSFRRFFDEMVKKVLLVEQELIDEIYMFKGHPDLIVEIKEAIVVIDLKTPIVLQKAWQLQLSCYLHLAQKNEYKAIKAGSLRLHPEGKTAKMEWYDPDANDFNVFLGLLNGWRYFNG